MEVADDHRRDVLGRDPGGLEIGQQMPGRGRAALAETGIDQHDAVRRLDRERIEGERQLVGRHAGFGKGRTHLGIVGVADEAAGPVAGERAIVQRDRGELAQRIAEETRSLLIRSFHGAKS